MIKEIGIIGRIANDSNLCDGQTIKTRILYDELKKEYDVKYNFVETYEYKKNVFKVLKDLFLCVKKSDVIFVLLSRNGMKVIFPILNFLNLFYKKMIIHDCIGGSIGELIEKNFFLRQQLKMFNINYVESEKIVEDLKSKGINNCEFLPNFKNLKILEPSDLKEWKDDIFKFCTFSRVNKDKGISVACEALTNINKKCGYKKVQLDIYGPIEENYETTLKSYISNSNGAITYKGVADFSQSVNILREYYMLLFPTTFYGEGFPGTLIDALSSGLPVIATDWHLNSEIIKNDKTGFIYNSNDSDKLEELIEYTINNKDQIFKMRKNCIIEAKKYTPQNVMNIIKSKIENV